MAGFFMAVTNIKTLLMSTQTLSRPKTLKRRGEIKSSSVTRPASKKSEADKDIAETYNEVKQFEGAQYTGMKVGRSHKWYYDKGEWKETKITPDLCEISYAVTKQNFIGCKYFPIFYLQ